jgi:hypothetical protein
MYANRKMVAIYERALREIRKGGHVCANFEFCEHQSCCDSASSNIIAGDALREAAEELAKETERQRLYDGGGGI